MIIDERVDVKENVLIEFSKEVLETLLIDRTTKNNIIWATDNYKDFGKGYKPKDKITIDRITGIYGNIIKPRIEKSKKEQLYRTKDKAEVFTPSWLCNKMNNLLDEQRLSKNSFNVEDNKKQTWKTNSKSIKFKKNYDFKKYIKENVLEITCGEAPYLVSRYDTVTGRILDIKDRIGLLDRKIRVINENVDTKNKDLWIKYVKEAYKHTYGYEWQGDSLLIARENLLYTFKDYYEYRFKKSPPNGLLKDIAEIISYNIWQMDGLKGVIPYSCKNKKAKKETTLFDFMGAEEYKDINEVKEIKCKGCTSNDFLAGLTKHNGTYCKIKDWDNDKLIKFISTFKKGKDSNMKFDYCIGNPPYQEGKQQIYPLFYNAAKEISNFVDMIFPVGWQEPKSANGLKVVNNKETKEDNQIILIDNVDDVFPNYVTGAKHTNIILWKNGYNNDLNGKQRILHNSSREKIESLVYTFDNKKLPSDLISIMNKVKSTKDFNPITSIISISNNLNLKEVYKDYPEVKKLIGSDGKDKRFERNIFDKLPAFVDKQKNDKDIHTIGTEGNKRVWKYIKEKYVDLNHPNLFKYKLLVSAAAASEFGSSLSDFIIAKPKDGYTRSFIGFGMFNSVQPVYNLAKYLKTKFVRTLLYTLKNGRMNNKYVWANVPIQDFNNNSDINWSKIIKDIDKQLYKKYGLTNKEISFIESHVKEMN